LRRPTDLPQLKFLWTRQDRVVARLESRPSIFVLAELDIMKLPLSCSSHAPFHSAEFKVTGLQCHASHLPLDPLDKQSARMAQKRPDVAHQLSNLRSRAREVKADSQQGMLLILFQGNENALQLDFEFSGPDGGCCTMLFDTRHPFYLRLTWAKANKSIIVLRNGDIEGENCWFV
jgi:hypothetical protein